MASDIAGLCGNRNPVTFFRLRASGSYVTTVSTRRYPMRYVLQTATKTIVEMDSEFYCYAGSKLIRVCPSEGMAREVLAGY